MKKCSVCLALLVCFVAVLPAVAQVYTWQDGAVLRYYAGHNLSERHATITANKVSHGWYTDAIEEVSTVTLSLLCKAYGDVPDPIPQVTLLDIRAVTVPVPGDPDHFEVSHDLGWAGLDTIVVAYDHVSGQNVPVELHLDWYANTRVRQESGMYQRGARVTGWIETEACDYDLSRDNHFTTDRGSIFSTARPQPYYG